MTILASVFDSKKTCILEKLPNLSYVKLRYEKPCSQCVSYNPRYNKLYHQVNQFYKHIITCHKDPIEKNYVESKIKELRQIVQEYYRGAEQ